MSKKTQKFKIGAQIAIDVVFIKCSSVWTAISVNHYVAAQGNTIPDALNAFMYAFLGQVLVHRETGLDPFVEMKPAPEVYQQIFKKAIKLDTKKDSKFPVPAWIPETHIIDKMINPREFRVY